MNIILSNSSDKPIYEQISSQVKAQILSGTLAAGAKLPSIRALASDLGVSVITTKRAYADLEQLGFICTVQGKGCFVAEGNQELLRENQLCHIRRATRTGSNASRNPGRHARQAARDARPGSPRNHAVAICKKGYTMQKLLELKGVSRRVSDRFSLRDVTLAVEPGQIVGFVGANGAGKTTTIRAALGLIKPDAGEVHLLGQRCDTYAPDETQHHLRSRVGLVLDTCPFPSTLKVGQVEALVGPAYPTWSRETFAGFIDRFGLDAKTKVKDLSRAWA